MPICVAVAIEIYLFCVIKIGFVSEVINVDRQCVKHNTVNSLLNDVLVRPSCGICLGK